MGLYSFLNALANRNSVVEESSEEISTEEKPVITSLLSKPERQRIPEQKRGLLYKVDSARAESDPVIMAGKTFIDGYSIGKYYKQMPSFKRHNSTAKR
jgi:hypothetical protein